MADTIDVYSTATQMLASLRARTISSVQLIEMHLARIIMCDGSLNAIPVRTEQRPPGY